MILQKMVTFPYSGHIRDSCRFLSERNEYPTDKYLYPMIELQCVSEKLNRLSYNRAGDLNMTSSALVAFTSSLRSDLDNLRESLSFSISDSCEFSQIQTYGSINNKSESQVRSSYSTTLLHYLYLRSVSWISSHNMPPQAQLHLCGSRQYLRAFYLQCHC